MLVLNLHSMCVAHLGKTPLLFWFLLVFLLLDVFFYPCYLLSASKWNQSTLSLIFVTSVCTSTTINSISIPKAPLHFIAWFWSGWNYSLPIFAVGLLKLSLDVVRYGLLHISYGLDLNFQFSPLLSNLLSEFTHLCFKLQMAVHSLQLLA